MINELEETIGGKKDLRDYKVRKNLPNRGIYIFFSLNEKRETSVDLRITRIGTHAISKDSKRTLWNRLKEHQGSFTGKRVGGGNHRGSIFRKLVGEALIIKYNLANIYPEWGKKKCLIRVFERGNTS